MDGFNFSFSLFGLVLGLSIVEVLGGFARLIRSRDKVRAGLLTPLLGILLIVDLTTFWAGIWNLRDQIQVNLHTLAFGVLIASIYYMSAVLFVPERVQTWREMDDYYWRHRRLVLAGPLTVTILINGAILLLLNPGDLFWRYALPPTLTVALFAALMLVRVRWLSIALMLAAIATDFIQ
jgi:hypothetical protein